MLTPTWSNPTNSKVTTDRLTKPINVITGAYLSWEATNLACQFTNCFLDMYVTCCTDRSVLIVLCACTRIHIFHIFIPDCQEAKLVPLSTQLLKHYWGLVIKYYLSLQACHSVWGLLAGKKKKKRNLKYLPSKCNISYSVLLRCSWIFAENAKNLCHHFICYQHVLWHLL